MRGQFSALQFNELVEITVLVRTLGALAALQQIVLYQKGVWENDEKAF